MNEYKNEKRNERGNKCFHLKINKKREGGRERERGGERRRKGLHISLIIPSIGVLKLDSSQVFIGSRSIFRW